ncbi:hypothetical protein [Polymorphospora rubra]|uniref:hypothetical protein n=1 Tax=Polymorphospora rubra TaxID=338584 RepID=UPI001BB42085|nr:hypothetical protein [Polymorphospora rubra]
MNGASNDQPSPIHDGCVFSPFVRPSTEADEYVNEISGARPPGAGGTRTGYDHVNPPPDCPACHDADDASDDF